MTTLLAHVRAAQGSGLKEAGISIDALGGAVERRRRRRHARSATAARWPPCSTPRRTTSGPATPRDRLRARRSARAMTPRWGTGAYVNYADASLADYQHGLLRRQRRPARAGARRRTTPHRFFTQPQDF